MLLTIERVAILRSIDMFDRTPGYALAAVAAIVEEIEVSSGETFIHEGSFGDSMYIVVEGEVEVYSDEKSIIRLGPGKSVGELAVLDPEPRSASVSAVVDSFLFRIGKDAFDEVLADRPEISYGVIRALCQRIRDQGRLVTNDIPKIGAPPADRGE